MAPNSTSSRHFFQHHCVCNWGAECIQLKKLLLDANGPDGDRGISLVRNGTSL
jgi:hypothetical protein